MGRYGAISILPAVVMWSFQVSAWAGPRIACKEPEFNFGDKPNTGVVEHVFLIENSGDAPLRIGKIHACCGATAAISTNIIDQGTNAALKVSLFLQGRRGTQKKSFYVGSNDPKEPYYQVRTTGNAVAEVFVEPDNVEFGDLRPTNEVEKTVRLVCPSNIALSVTNIIVDTTRFAASYDRTNDGYLIKVRTVPPHKPGAAHGNMSILTDNEKHRQFDVYLAATLASDIQLIPREITVLSATGRVESVTRYVAIRSKRGIPFKILAVESPEPGIEVKVDSMRPTGYRLEIRNILPFPELDGKRFIIRTDHEDGREIPVTIRLVPRTEPGK